MYMWEKNFERLHSELVISVLGKGKFSKGEKGRPKKFLQIFMKIPNVIKTRFHSNALPTISQSLSYWVK